MSCSWSAETEAEALMLNFRCILDKCDELWEVDVAPGFARMLPPWKARCSFHTHISSHHLHDAKDEYRILFLQWTCTWAKVQSWRCYSTPVLNRKVLLTRLLNTFKYPCRLQLRLQARSSGRQSWIHPCQINELKQNVWPFRINRRTQCEQPHSLPFCLSEVPHILQGLIVEVRAASRSPQHYEQVW